MSIMSAPQTMEDFRERLLQLQETMPKRLRQCADYVLEHSDKIAVSTVSQLAQEAGVQPSAFMRFCQLLGFSGFSEMQRLFRDSFKQAWPDYSTRLQNLQDGHADEPAALLADFVEAGRISLERLLVSVDEESLRASVDLLSKAPVIHLIGYRRAFPVASYLAYAFEKMEIPSILHDGVGQLNAAHSIREGDAVVAVTFAPYSAETIELVAASKDLGADVVAITDAMAGPLQKLGAIPLLVSEVDVGAFRALSASLSLAICLAVAVGTHRKG
ncbi:MAG: MurR/RpiR family transcriptional regulator [Cohaesibacter sp.]|nr:MurR/RpiR family transcriptional regulator [Cohaesibacter sp.]